MFHVSLAVRSEATANRSGPGRRSFASRMVTFTAADPLSDDHGGDVRVADARPADESGVTAVGVLQRLVDITGRVVDPEVGGAGLGRVGRAPSASYLEKSGS